MSDEIFSAVYARPKRRQGITGQTIDAQMRGTICQITELELEELRDELARLRAEVERLTIAAASWEHTARQLEAGRAEARAQVAALMQDRADLAQIIDNAITPNDADEHRLLLNGSYHTGPVVDWVHRVMIAMRDLLRKDPSKAQAAIAQHRAQG